MSAKGIIVDRIKHYGPSGIAEIFDIDFTLLNTMETASSDKQKALILELYLRTAGGVAFVTGRSSKSVDKTFPGLLPGSFEHHSAIRLKQGQPVIALASKTNILELASHAKSFIGEKIQLAEDPEELRDASGNFSCVYPEIKDYALALVHSVGHSNVDNDRDVLEAAANYAIEKMAIGSSHKITIGNDAIEIVPRGLDEKSEIVRHLDVRQIAILRASLNKASAMHNFMNSIFEGRNPNYWGDSPKADGPAIETVFNDYAGVGTWVLNDKPLPRQFANAVEGRVLQNYFASWPEIEAAIDHLRSHSTITIIPKDMEVRTPS